MKSKKLFYTIFLSLSSSFLLMANSNKIIITEFMAINSNNITDGDNEYSDWIELYNSTESDINMNGWYLTDNAENLSKWKFPSVTIQKGTYLIVFASGKDKTDDSNYLHTDFKLSGSGEFLAICEPDNNISSAYNPTFPAQRQDISFGIYEGQEVYFTTPTPGAKNSTGSSPFAPNFSITRGFYTDAFNVTLASPVSDCTIYYTLDGTLPNKTTGTVYTAPINIITTTPLSAVAINSSNQSSEIVSHTYWFIKDIVQQSNTPAGYPSDWKQAGGSSVPADYEMDSEICNSTEYKDYMEEALLSIPSMNIVTTKENLFSNVDNETTGGIYVYTGKPSANGVDWVRPTSVEYFDPKTGEEFQLNCRLKLHGGNSRNPGNSPKHGFGLTFSSDYGPSKLNFNLFNEKKVVNEFNTLVLRAGYNYSWTKNNITQRNGTQYLNDPWAKNTQLAMGKTSAHERFVHLYINGLYWGVYNISEKYTDDFFESYMKGQEEDFDIIKEKQVVSSGNIDAFNALISQMKSSLSNNANYQKIQGKNSDGTVNPAYPNLLDMDNYIDYMLVNYYIGNKDWNKNNWVMARNRVSNESGFRFVCWDAETTFTDKNFDLVSEKGDSKNPMNFIEYLKGNSEFKILMADRIQKHMVANGGALTPAEVIARYEELADEIDLAIIGESARWGDYRKDVAPNDDNRILYTREHWLTRKQELINDHFKDRTDIVIEQLREKGVFPDIEAPLLSHEGGDMEEAIDLEITANSGQIYYTTDGSDPREPITSQVSSLAKVYNGTINIATTTKIRTRAKSGNEWSPITKATFDFNNGTGIKIIETEQLAIGNYPNPFHNRTQIHIAIPDAGLLQVNIYSIDGRLVQKLFKGEVLGGSQDIEWVPQNIKTGIYVCHINYNGQSSYLKLLRK